MMENNWENFLKNAGEWHGSFTGVSLTGELLDSTPSILTLDVLENHQLVKFRLRRFGSGGVSEPPTSDYVQEYRSVGNQVIFFDTGAFSKGVLQVAPMNEFGAEYGFVADDRRLRFVQLYDRDGRLNRLVLIREFRQDSSAQERPPLTVAQLLGEWQGKAWTVFSDWQPTVTTDTHLVIKDLGQGQLQQQLSFGDRTITSTAQVTGNILQFSDAPTPRQILLLPDGTSSNTPLAVNHRQSFFVELGWLVTPTERQRLIRSYNDKGEWVSATHVIEHKVA
jgi:Domain of unknown function (DUF3598)